MKHAENGYKVGDMFRAVKDALDISTGSFYQVFRVDEDGYALFMDDAGDPRRVETHVAEGRLQLVQTVEETVEVAKASNMKTVRIVSARNKSAWYAALVGATITVRDHDDHLYTVEDIRTERGTPFAIWKSDTEELGGTILVRPLDI
jgi:hypothetical protein